MLNVDAANPEAITTLDLHPFKEWPKIARLTREMVITEKIDGTNALVYIDDTRTIMKAGSRSKWVTPGDDNYGFAKWVVENHDELFRLGPGYHYGEWWGGGIQRNYGLKEKRFALFNVSRWHTAGVRYEGRPACCDVVPILYQGMFDTAVIDLWLETLRTLGSKAAPGFMKPEGLIVYHIAAGNYYKKTLEKDEEHKGKK